MTILWVVRCGDELYRTNAGGRIYTTGVGHPSNAPYTYLSWAAAKMCAERLHRRDGRDWSVEIYEAKEWI